MIENALNVANERGVWDMKTAYKLQHAMGVLRTKISTMEGSGKPGPTSNKGQVKPPQHKGN